MIETHAHVYDEAFDEDFQEMLDRALDSGIEQIWMPNCNSETIQPMFEVEKNNPARFKPMMGLHPSYVNDDFEKELAIVEQHLKQRNFILIGEIGIDFYWDLTWVKEQEKVFTRHLELAKDYNLPIVIHSRNSKDNEMNAIQRCCDLIEEFGWESLRGIFHCFSGTYEDALRVLDLNFLLGIGGVATFKNGKIDKFLKEIPLNKIVLETDSPYLAPVPYRGKRNEPSYINLVADKLSDIYEVSAEVIKKKTTENAFRLIGEFS